MDNPTDIPENDDRLNVYDSDMLHCRATNHLWAHVHDEIYDKNSRQVVILIRRIWRCDRCNTRRIDIINIQFWFIASRAYDYPDGYQLSNGAVDSRALRRELILRTSNLADILTAKKRRA